MPAHVDGNAIAGPLSEVFSQDMTAAEVTCASCGDVSPFATAMVYLKPHAFIVRCHRCDAVLATLLQSGEANSLDLDGIRRIRIPRL